MVFNYKTRTNFVQSLFTLFLILLLWTFIVHIFSNVNNGFKAVTRILLPFHLSNYSSNTKILILVPTQLFDTDLRNRARNAYGLCSLYNSSFPVSIRFLVGNNASPVEKEDWDLFHMEMTLFNDIVWDKGFIDSYKNLSIKIIRALRWTEIHFPNVWFIVKLDIDVFISLPNLLKFLPKIIFMKFDNEQLYYKNPTAILIGKLVENTFPIRRTRHKWYVSESVYPFDSYPKYNQGSFYILNHQAIDIILKNFSNMYENKTCRTCNLIDLNTTFCPQTRAVLNMEDVLINGILVENATRLHYVNIVTDLTCDANITNIGDKIASLNAWDSLHHQITDCTKIALKFEMN